MSHVGSQVWVVGRWVRLLSRGRDRHRVLISLSLFGLVITVAFTLAIFVRFELGWPGAYTVPFWSTLPVLLAIRLGLAWLFRLPTCRWRFVGVEDLFRLLVATTSGSAIFYVLTWHFAFPGLVLRSIILLEWVFTGYGIGGMWVVYRLLFQRIHRGALMEGRTEKRVLVVGAGEAAAVLVDEMKRLPVDFWPVALVDDEPTKQGTRINGVPVMGTISDARAVADLVSVDELLIAIPSATPDQLTRIVEICESTDRPFRLLPPIPEVFSGTARLKQLRTVKVEDLLGREPVNLELPELARELNGECILVSGAAGSIGSELSRQIALHHPGRLLLLDQAETPLVELDLQLRELFPGRDIVPLVRDITHEASIRAVFRRYRPRRVFHAAAYKHVPMMELNGAEAIRNNVFGTWIVARAAGEVSSSHFVLISTDKAVSPLNKMGVSKRLAELVVLEAQGLYPGTSFSAVRFGNVLGSNGSVIRLFQRQMEEGKPLTVTHPGMTRYFMTIPEAVQLVLEASLLPDLKGRIAMLEMGRPVRIVDLARRILQLSGSPAKLGRDIVFTGIRPGEKLNEELVWMDEESRTTQVSKIRVVVPSASPRPGLADKVSEWVTHQPALEEDLREAFLPWLDGRPRSRSRGAWRSPNVHALRPSPNRAHEEP